MKKTLILALLALASSVFIVSQAKADSWSTQYLVNQETSALSYFGGKSGGTKDTRGNKWFFGYKQGTAQLGNRLYQYTGSEWVDHTDTVRNLISASGMMEINSIYADLSGNVWTAAGPMLKFDGSSWTVVSAQSAWEQAIGHSISSWSSGTFNSVFGDSQGNLYSIAAADYDGITSSDNSRVIKRSADGTWSTAVPHSGILASDSYNALMGAYNNTNGDFWFYHIWGDQSGAYRYHNGSWTNYTTADGLPSNALNSLKIDSKGNVWVATANGAAKFDGSSWTVWNTGNSSLTCNRIRQISEDNSGKIWFTTTKEAGETDEGGAAIYDPNTGDWSYYTTRNAYDGFNNVSEMFFFGDEAWAWGQVLNGGNGFLVLTKTNEETTIYGQTSGDLVDKAGFDMAKKKKSKSTINSNKAVTIYKVTRVKKKKKYKTKKTLVYRTGVTQWYKALNLDTGKYQVVSKARGKKKHTQTINITSGDPYRLDLRY